MSAVNFLKNTRPDLTAADGRSGSLTHSPRLDHQLDGCDLPQISRSAPSNQRARNMSHDFNGPVSTQIPMYGQVDIDQALSSLHNGEPSHHHLGGGLPHNGFDHPDGMDIPEHSAFDMFSSSPSVTSFGSQRYRTNASSSSSLGPNYGMGGESAYSHSFADSVPSFAGGNPYDMGHSLSSSYSSGKISPLTPNDAMQQPPSLFSHQNGMNGGGKEFSPQHGYPNLLPDRRPSNMSNTSYNSDYSEEFTMDSVSRDHNGMNFPHPAMQQYQERLGRFQPGNHFSQPLNPPSVPSHMHHNHGPDVLRGVAPQSTHSYRPDIPAFDDMHTYMAPSPTGDLSLRVPGVDETLARMKLQGQVGIGASNDLHAFIRFVSDSLCMHSVLILFAARFWTNTFERITDSRSASVQSL